ncbi:MAG: hypothetical protein RQ756_08415 [Flavobacteriaceae bacterium]|nr:hypothetical protein [Flavobacteriaceae bacterium]
MRDGRSIDWIEPLSYFYYPLSNRLKKESNPASADGFKQQGSQNARCSKFATSSQLCEAS